MGSNEVWLKYKYLKDSVLNRGTVKNLIIGYFYTLIKERQRGRRLDQITKKKDGQDSIDGYLIKPDLI